MEDSHIWKGTRATLYVSPRCSLLFLISTPLPVRSFMNHLQQNIIPAISFFIFELIPITLIACIFSGLWLFLISSTDSCSRSFHGGQTTIQSLLKILYQSFDLDYKFIVDSFKKIKKYIR